ncbi:MAG: tetratricopeptide repeat protein, partial [Polyangia bacterium]
TQAEQLLRTAAAHSQPSDRGRLLEARAELLAAQSETRGAESLALLVEAARVDEQRAPMLYGKASARAAALYRDEDALRYAERAVAIAPTDPDAQERLGSLLEARDHARALEAYDRALELDPGRDRLRLRAAELALRRGNDDGAALRYRQLLARARDEQAIEEAAHRAVVVHELTGRLGVLEREIAPRVTGGDPQPALRRLLIEIDKRYVPVLAARAEAGEPAAKAELEHVAQHALGPLLDSIVEGERDERRAAVQLTGQLGARGAAPLLLRLAAGEAARKGSEPPPIELRTAAAEAAVALVSVAEIPKLLSLAADPEQRIRLAAVVALGRLAKQDTRAAAAVEHALSDGHQNVVAAACLALPPENSMKAPLELVHTALDEARPLAARACAMLLADRLATLDASTKAELVTRAAKLPRLSIGVARALLATDDPRSIERGLLSLLDEPALHRAPVTVPPATLDLAAATSAREARSLPPRDPETLTTAWLHLLAGDQAAVALADLLVEVPLAPRLVAGDDHEGARAQLLERGAAQLARLATSPSSTLRALAIALASETAPGLATVEAALQRKDDRRAALSALAEPRAVSLSGVDAERLVPALRGALDSSDWRERRAALSAIARQPELRTRLAAETARLARDDNGLVAALAARLRTPQ